MDISVDAFLERIRQEMNQEKMVLISDGMRFTSDEAAKFWPVYNKYEQALQPLQNDRIQLIRDYLNLYTMGLTDKETLDLARRSMALEKQRLEMKMKYYDIFVEEIGVGLATRFFQLEGLLLSAVDLKLSMALPAVPGDLYEFIDVEELKKGDS